MSGNVTGIQTITNLTNDDIEFLNTEDAGNNRTIKSQWTVDVGNAWVPWCDDKGQFDAHHMQLTNKATGAVLAYIWQQKIDGNGDFVRYSPVGYVNGAKYLTEINMSHNLTVMQGGSIVPSYV